MPLRKRQIHGVDDDDFQTFSALARLNGMTIGGYLGVVARQEWDKMVEREKGKVIPDAVESKP